MSEPIWSEKETPMLWARGISFAYQEEGAPIFENLSLQVQKGEFVAILGHNGSGKSTLAKHFNGILLPTAGKVLVDGMDTVEEALLWQLRCKVGLVFQNPDNQLVATKVEEDVAFAPENLGVDPAEIRQRVDEALQAVGMYELRHRAPHELSGGQKQRVAIAGVIAMRPHCIVLDEPTAMLDPRGRQEVMQTVQKLRKAYGMTVLLITHFMQEAVQADRVVVMDDGKLLLNGTPKEVFAQGHLLEQVGLDLPQTAKVGQLLAQKGVSLPADLLTEEAFVQALVQTYPAKGAPAVLQKAAKDLQQPADCTPTLTAQSPLPANSAVSLRGVGYTYGGADKTQALLDVNFDLPAGSFTALVGHTGSGKSTLVQMLNGLNKPTKGKVFINGREIWEQPKQMRQVRFEVGLVFQYPEYQLFEETVFADMAFGPKNMGLSAEEVQKRVKMAAAFVGLSEEMLQKSPFDLSGGQKRRAAIGGVLAMQPKVLVLDEPTAGLDPKGREQLLTMLQQYQRQTNSTLLLISHAMEDVAKYAQQVLVLNDGKIALCGPTQAVFGHGEALNQMGLAVPQVTRLSKRLSQLGYEVGQGVLTPQMLADRLAAVL